MIEGLEFHHIGWACRSLEREAPELLKLGYAPQGETFVDSGQGIRGRFLVGPGPMIELLEPLPGTQTLRPWLDRETKMYHLAYLTSDLQATLDVMRAERARVVVQPLPAPAFDDRRIAFVVMPNMMLVELIEQP